MVGRFIFNEIITNHLQNNEKIYVPMLLDAFRATGYILNADKRA